MLPFVLLVGISLMTRPTDPEIVAGFYARLKTPVGATPEADALALGSTTDPKRGRQKLREAALFYESTDPQTDSKGWEQNMAAVANYFDSVFAQPSSIKRQRAILRRCKDDD